MTRPALPAVLLALLAVGSGCLLFGAADHTQFTLTAEQISSDRLATDALSNLSVREADVVAEAHRNGVARVLVEPLGVDGAYVERNGSYYQVHRRDGSTVERERYVVSFEPVNRSDARAAGTLPDEDEQAAQLAYRAYRIREDGRDAPPLEYVYRTTPNESVFVPDPEVRHVRVRNVTFRASTSTRNVSLRVHEYALERVAANESAFVVSLVHDLSGLSRAELRPLERAIQDRNYTSRARRWEDAEDPVEPLAGACDVELMTIVYEGPVRCYVEYEGRYYRLNFDGHTTAA